MAALPKSENEDVRLRDEIVRGTRVVSISGLTSIAAKALVLTRLQADTGKTFVVVSDSNPEMEAWTCDLEFFQSKVENQKSKIISLPSFETDPYSGTSPHAETQERRALTLWYLTNEQPDFLVLPARSLISRVVPRQQIQALGGELKLNSDFPLENLLEKFVAAGYVREEPLNNIGQFSVRGGIVDVWSPNMANPVRLEFFGDTVDSIRAFDIDTQLSV